MRRWIGMAVTGFAAGFLCMLVVGSVTLWLLSGGGWPIGNASSQIRHVISPLALSNALWAGLCGAVATVLVEWMFGRLTDWAGWILFAALFLILLRFHGLHLSLVSLETTLLFAVVWAGGTWLLARTIAGAARRLQRRKP
jgi:hypothetical protein